VAAIRRGPARAARLPPRRFHVLRGLDPFSLGHSEERHGLVLCGERMDVSWLWLNSAPGGSADSHGRVSRHGPIRRAAPIAFAAATLAGLPTVVARMEWSHTERYVQVGVPPSAYRRKLISTCRWRSPERQGGGSAAYLALTIPSGPSARAEVRAARAPAPPRPTAGIPFGVERPFGAGTRPGGAGPVDSSSRSTPRKLARTTSA
jgi:hypothetical protein